MAVDFLSSETKENLMRAFAGESQARNRYTFAASAAKRHGMPVIEAVFTFTADQEKEHAEVFYNYLKEATGENITVDGAYPVDTYDDVKSLLKAAVHNEEEEHGVVYPAFGDKAKEEGFPEISHAFYEIAKIERTHAERFARFARYLEENKLFVSDVKTGWMCLNCGYQFEGTKAPAQCPVCKHEQGYFIRLKLAPYAEYEEWKKEKSN